MKNNFYKISLLFLFLLINFNTKLLANEINFEAKNIETIEENFISASGEVYIYDNLGNKIFSNKLLIDNKAKIYTIKENVTLKNENNEITLNANELIFDQGKNTIKTLGKTRINKNNNYLLETSNIVYDLNTKKIFSNENTILKDLEPNEIDVQNFKLDLNQNTFVANNVLMTDKELNIFNIKKIYYDFNNERILGQDISINDINELSTKRHLSRAKGKTFIYENGNFTLSKGIYTNCMKREGCSPWSIAAKEVKHDKKKKTINYINLVIRLFYVVKYRKFKGSFELSFKQYNFFLNFSFYV